MGQGHDETTPYVPYDFLAANQRYRQSALFTPDPIVGARSRTGIICCADARCSPENFFMLPPNEAFVIRNGGGRTGEDSVIRTLALIQCLSEVKEVKVVHHTDCGALAYSDPWVRSIIATNDPNTPGGPWKPAAPAWAENLAYLPFADQPELFPLMEPEKETPAEGKKTETVVPVPAAAEAAEAIVENGEKATEQEKMRATERKLVERSIRLDVMYLKTHPLVKESVVVSGWVFDLHTGKVEPVEC